MGDLVTIERMKEPGEFGRPAPVFRLRKQVSQEHAARIAEAQRAAYRRRFPLADIGNGPWRVLADCPAPRHNTYAAARGWARGNPDGVRCICPRALACVEEYNKKRRAETTANLPAGMAPRSNGQHTLTWATVDAQIHRAEYYRNITPATVPDLSRGACRTEWGLKVADKAASCTTNAAEVETAAVRRAKEMCLNCPVMVKCLEDVTRRETPAGRWGGVLGGLSAYERAQKSWGVGQ